jgi:hypothetical protein
MHNAIPIVRVSRMAANKRPAMTIWAFELFLAGMYSNMNSNVRNRYKDSLRIPCRPKINPGDKAKIRIVNTARPGFFSHRFDIK